MPEQDRQETTLLNEQLLFHPEDDKTNRIVAFSLDEEADSLRIECRYSPKVVDDPALARRAVLGSIGRYVPRYQLPLYEKQWERVPPLVNLLTLSLDYEQEYLGCAHRHAPRQTHTLSAQGSSPGFVRHAPRKGRYRAVINVHSVTSAEVVYHLEVTAIKEGKAP